MHKEQLQNVTLLLFHTSCCQKFSAAASFTLALGVKTLKCWSACG